MSEKKTNKNANKKWLRFRHRVVRNLACAVIKPYSYVKYGVRVDKFKEQEKRAYLVLFNHQTPFDQFFVGMSFKRPIYYLATEDIFSLGWISSLIRYLVAPIPIKKQTTDIRAILNCIKVAKEGGTIALAPEGNRTYSGRTEYINPSIVPLAKKLGLPIALYRLEGGYGVEPRWSDVVRRGNMHGYVAKVIYPEEYADMPDDELYRRICDGLYVDEARADAEFRHKRLAEYLERAIYVCPECGLSNFESRYDVMECKKCGRSVRYLPTKELCGEGFDLPFRFVGEWYDYQSDFVNSLDVLEYTDEPLYTEEVMLSEVIPYKKKNKLAKKAEICLYGDRVTVIYSEETVDFDFDGVTAAAVLGRNKLNIYHGGKVYQIKGSKRFNALKYVQIYHRYKNIKKGDPNVKFLGL